MNSDLKEHFLKVKESIHDQGQINKNDVIPKGSVSEDKIQNASNQNDFLQDFIFRRVLGLQEIERKVQRMSSKK